MKPALLVHGGAGPWKDVIEDEAIDGVKQATTIGWETLSAGGSALDAVEKACNYLEDHPLFDAGKGSYLNEWGEVEMDALICDGSSLNFGAVAAVRRVQHPISLARRAMTETDYNFFVGDGADQLAAKFGIPLLSNLDFVTESMFKKFAERDHAAVNTMGTVGAVAIDSDGHIAAATTTGGSRDKPKGRVGDSPIFGAGGYANPFGAASATGVGEHILRVLLCKYAIDQLALGDNAQKAATAAAQHINSYFDPSEIGIIIIDNGGNIGAAHTTANMPIGWVDATGRTRGSMGGGVNALER